MQVKGISIISTFRKFQKNVLMHHPSIKKSVVQGIDVYLMLVKVFDTGRSMVTYFYVIGYGGPAVIVVLSVILVEASGTHGYGTPDQ